MAYEVLDWDDTLERRCDLCRKTGTVRVAVDESRREWLVCERCLTGLMAVERVAEVHEHPY